MFSVGLLDVGRSKNARVPVRGALDDAAEAGTAAGPITRFRLFSGATVDDSLRMVGGVGGSMLVGSGFLVWTAGGGSIVMGAFIFLAAGIGNDDSFLFVSLGGGGP